MNSTNFNLIADIGGTNARFALLEEDNQTPIEIKSLACSDYSSVVDAIHAYLDSISFVRPDNGVIAVATAVTDDHLKLTNNNWQFSIEETRKALGFGHLKVINDFTALSLAVPHLSPNQYTKINDGDEVEVKSGVKAVIGPGTGLGVSAVMPNNDIWLPLESEGGHVSYGPLNEREAQVIEIIKNEMDHVSAETLVSGAGLSLLYKTISILEGKDINTFGAEEISRNALDQSCPIAHEALSMFCEILGTVAGNLALTIGSRGGVYIGGGIVPKNLDFFTASNFLERFEQHGRFTRYLRDIPIYVITEEYPAFAGVASALKPEYESLGINSYR